MSGVVTFDAADGTRLACHQTGQGRPLLCLPGGPMQASAYLGDLGGLSAHRALVLLDLRGTGRRRSRRTRRPSGTGPAPSTRTPPAPPGGGQFPWLDDPGWFVRTAAGFLR
jgi:pimeloyl-ACP methyl ester carboxylesterase